MNMSCVKLTEKFDEELNTTQPQPSGTYATDNQMHNYNYNYMKIEGRGGLAAYCKKLTGAENTY